MNAAWAVPIGILILSLLALALYVAIRVSKNPEVLMMRALWISRFVLCPAGVLALVVFFAKVGSMDVEVAAIVAAVVLFLFLVAYGWACASGVMEYSKASALHVFASYLRCTALAIAGVFALRLAWQLICGTA